MINNSIPPLSQVIVPVQIPSSEVVLKNKTINIQKITSSDFGVESSGPIRDYFPRAVENMTIINYSPETDNYAITANEINKEEFGLPDKPRFGGIESSDMPATILIFDATKLNIIFRTNKFILQSINRPKMEKFQIVETFGDAHFFFFDERTKVYTFTGVMLDAFYSPKGNYLKEPFSRKYQWAQGFQDFYDNYFRGTQLSRNNQIAAIYVNEMIIKGYPIQLAISKESSNFPDGIQFQMTWLIKEEILLQAAGAKNLYDNTSNSSEAVTNAWNAYYSAVQMYKDKKLRYEQVKSATFGNIFNSTGVSSISVEDLNTSKSGGVIGIAYDALERAYRDVQVAIHLLNSLESARIKTSDWD
jgi:hypothetical protein